MYQELRKRVLDANKQVMDYGLVTLTWGNVSEIDRVHNVVAIKPSGVDYATMSVDDIVVVDLDGNIVEGTLNPSSDLATHLYIYTIHDDINSVVHTHSTNATAFAQAGVDIENLGTTHSDHFQGAIPCTRIMTDEEILNDYEYNTGVVIGETFTKRNLDASVIMACLVNNHGPFVWGKSIKQAVENALVLEVVAKMNIKTKSINLNIQPIKTTLQNKHYLRKHGKRAYYGQGK